VKHAAMTLVAAVAAAALSGCGPATAPPAGPLVPPVVAPAGLDVAVVGLEVTQGSQTYPAQDVPLVQNRSGWVRVFLRASAANALTPTVRVRFRVGATVHDLLLPPPAAAVPTAVDPLLPDASWNAAVPADWFQPGASVEVDLPLFADADASNDRLAPRTLDVKALATWRVTLIPVHTTDGLTGTVETASRDRVAFVDFARRIHPVPDAVDVRVAAVFSSSAGSLASGQSAWSTVLSEIDAKRAADGASDRYYYGVVATSYTSGIAGLGYVGAPGAVGWDRSSAPQVLAHEVGHNFGRDHSPCGSPSGVDPSYPTTGDYAGGHIGVPGWDVFSAAANLKAPALYTDIMGYCGSQWVSDYTYRGVLKFRQASGMAAQAQAVGKAAGEGLLVWGRIEDGQVVLEPAFRVPATANLPESGPLAWEARDVDGRVLARVSFQARPMADGPGDSAAFAFVVPLTPEALAAAGSQHLLAGSGRELAMRQRQVAVEGSPAPSPVPTAATGGRLVWDARRHPVAMLRDARSGEVRGFARGGSAELGAPGEDLEVHLSDGVRSGLAIRIPAAK
jgi:hypothetical protein